MSKYRRRLMMQEKKVIKPYMHIEALEDGLTVSLSTNAIEYSLDGSTWVTLPADTASPAIKAGRKIYFRGELTPAATVGIGTFTLNKRCNAGGNAMSLLFGDDFENRYSLSGKNRAFYTLFSGCTTLEGVSDDFLPATTLSSHCYGAMFSQCTSLKSAPDLPATTLAYGCYSHMFYYCKSLEVAQKELPATTLAENCYFWMYYDCLSLKSAPDLPATTLTEGCYDHMFTFCYPLNYIKALFTTTPGSSYTDNWVYRVASTGTFVKNKDATWDVTGEDGIPSGWIQEVWPKQYYILDLNNQWQVSNVTNPDSTLYDGVYESFSNQGVDNTAAIMYIDIVGYTDFSLYIRSYAESSFDYVMVSQLDQTIDNNTSYRDTTLVKAHTRGSQTSGTTIGNYTLVEFTGMDGGEHRITVLYRKDSSSSDGKDKGYLLIPKNQ